MSSKFFTNSSDRSLFDKFTGIVESMKDLYAFHAVVGYFRSSGYFALQPYLKNLNEIKILVGINVDQMFAEAQRKGLLFFGDEQKTKSAFLDWFIEDVRKAKYTKEVEDGILQFIEDVISGRIEVRAHNSKALHAKFYLFLPEVHNEHSDGWVIMGSSNLTEAGLGVRQSPNYELNIALKDYDDVQFARNEFQKLWEDSTSILPADIDSFKNKTHIGHEFTPHEIYIKFLISYFDRSIDYDPDTVGDLPSTYKKLTYQIDAVNEGFQMLLEHNGFFLADVVGLGKTVVAAMIAKRFLISNGTLHSKLLVVYPPALEKNWKDTFRQFGIDRHTKFITNGRLEKIVLGNDPDYWPKEDYDLILVDEAHRYRNHTSQMFQNLQLICKSARSGDGLLEGDKKRVMLISATPLNNRPQDIYYQLQLFQDARRSSLPETNLQAFFGPIIKKYRDIISAPDPDMDEIRELYQKMRERVISPITVRRTRKDLDKYPKYRDDLRAQNIDFPDIMPPIAIEYELVGDVGALFVESMAILTDEVKYFRYQAVGALIEEVRDAFYPQAKIVSNSLARILQTLMVKRLESSFFAFRRTLANIAKATERMIQMFEQDKVLIAPDFDVNALMDKGNSIEDIEAFILEKTLDDPNSPNRIFQAKDFEPEFLTGLRRDLELLDGLVEKWATVTSDPKLDEFFDQLENKFQDAEINPTGKLVIFTESKDTADYLAAKIEDRLSIEPLNISAANRRAKYETIRDNFDANFAGEQKDDHKILISTDVLAEGVNLHRANVIISYDTPWNATRLMQRIGRVNRIGSVADKIYNFNFYPSPQGNVLIRLYQKALVKLQGFHSAFGEDAQIYTHQELVEQFELFNEGLDDEEDRRLHYLRVIRDFKETSPNEFKRIKNLPLKARTARKAKNIKRPGADGSTVVFLKSPYKSEFYRVDKDNKVSALTFLEAVGFYEADEKEKPEKLPVHHYEQVLEALGSFEKDFFGSASEAVTSTEKADARSNQAKKFLRDIRGYTKYDHVKSIATSLIDLIDRGVYAQLPNEVRKMRQKLEKKQLTYPQVESLIVQFGEKFGAIDAEIVADHTEELSANVEPEIILSESFVL
ncbi:MAG: DEAD/DEAH box helicase family protein [Acidobacteria bacterium]|nr:DEAD/DEAH box helicase family protein [Acidobacteriota bacterium]